ncbi:iron ABC transporter permease [Actinomyces sp.]|uniref:FecCD family ABC transporter permease n=1 Tax=Actinomyces sp. TaxID=29317 RepID=UPI0028A05303|nr:iron ABC transporter permease [Actinomyces sp.]
MHPASPDAWTPPDPDKVQPTPIAASGQRPADRVSPGSSEMTGGNDPVAVATRPTEGPPTPISHRGLLLGMLVALVPLAALSLAVGSRLVPVGTVVEALRAFDPTDDAHLVAWELRVPRTLIAVLAGACLGLAGALMQTLTRNALAEPGTLGVNSGAAAGVVVGLAITGAASVNVYVWFAFLGAGIASLVVHRLGRAGEAGVNPVRLVLAGAGLSVMLSSVTMVVILSSPQTVFDSFRNWATGSLQGRGWDSVPVAAGCLLIGIVLAGVLAGPLNSVALGPDLAAALGVDTRRTWALTNLAVLILAGGATAVAGPIAFVGLAAPHVARAVLGTDHRWLLPGSALVAAFVLLLADVLGRVVIHPGEVGAGVMTALIGAPFFVVLVRRGRVVGL